MYSEKTNLNRLNELEKDLEGLHPADEKIDVSNLVMRKISAGKTKGSPLSHYTSFFGSLLRPAPVSFAIVLVAGVILGSALTLILFSGENNEAGNQVLSGTLTSNPKEGFSFSNKSTELDVVAYKIGNLHYINLLIDTQPDLQVEISFNGTDFSLKKSGYISFRGKETDTYENGTVMFLATGKTSFQIVLEKLNDQLAGITVAASHDNSLVINRQIFLK